MNPVLSVIIPCYNGEKYICRAVESVLSQPEAKQIDILIVDDGSKDNSGALCDRLAEEYDNVRVVHKENGGVSSARNLGIEYAMGKYVGFMDCDDWWEPDVFDSALAMELSSEKSADVYQFSFREVNYDRTLEKRYVLQDGSFQYEAPGFGRYDWSHHCAFFHSRKLLMEKEIRYLLCKVGEDGPMVEMALYWAQSFKQSHKVLYTYWENMGSVVHTTDPMRSLKEQCRGILEKKQYYEKFGVFIDEETERTWQILTSLPKLCAQTSYQDVKRYMEENCLSALEKRPDIRFGPHLWTRLEVWKRKPCQYWLEQRIRVGLPLAAKSMMLNIPGIRRWTNHAYTRYHRRFSPIGK